MLGGESPFTIKPNRGQYLVHKIEEPSNKLVNHIILPVPFPGSKGISFWNTLYGDLVVGPTSHTQSSRNHPNITRVLNSRVK